MRYDVYCDFTWLIVSEFYSKGNAAADIERKLSHGAEPHLNS